MTTSERPLDDITDLLATWPEPKAAGIAVVGPNGLIAAGGDSRTASRVASISKVFTALAVLIAVEEGTLDLDEAAGPEGSTVRHLLAHASGLAFDEDRTMGQVGARRIYSNVGVEYLAGHLATRANMPFAQYLAEAVFQPLQLGETTLQGSAAFAVRSNVADLARLTHELLVPTLIAAETWKEMTTPQFPELSGVLPGIGRFSPNQWGLGVEIRGTKHPHWTAPENSATTFGHFGGTGTFLWVDPAAGLGCTAISGTEFGPWALEAWPATSEQVLARYASP